MSIQLGSPARGWREAEGWTCAWVRGRRGRGGRTGARPGPGQGRRAGGAGAGAAGAPGTRAGGGDPLAGTEGGRGACSGPDGRDAELLNYEY